MTIRNIILFPFRKYKLLNKLTPFLPFYEDYNIPAKNLFREIFPTREIDLNIDFHFADNAGIIDYKKIQLPAFSIFRFSNVVIMNECGAIMDKNKTIYRFTWRGKSIDNWNFYYNIFPFFKKLYYEKKGIYFFCPTNYWHFHYEYLNRLKWFIDNFEENILIYSNQLSKNWQLQLLKFYDIDLSKIIFIPDSVLYVKFKELYFVSFPGTPYMGFGDDFSSQYLKENINKSYKLKLNSIKQNIYISRKKAETRKIINEDELEKFLIEKNFEIYCFEDLDIQKQYEICANAKVVMALHGSGLTNIIACSGSVIIEFFIPQWPMCMYALASSSTMNRYYRLNVKPLDEANPQQTDVVVDINKLKGLLLNLKIIN